MYALLFFLPIYYRVIKEHSPITTALLLLSQTLMIAPCGVLVFVLVERFKLSPHWVIFCGWLCTSCGIGLLTMLGAEKAVSSDILLNLLSGFGLGVLLPALAIGAKDNADGANKHQAPILLVYMRYLGSASGLVATGIAFQRLLRQNLASTEFQSKAAELTKHATTLMYSIHDMPDSQGKRVLVQATEDALCTIWIALSVLSAAVCLLSLTSTLMATSRATAGTDCSIPGSEIALEPPAKLTLSIINHTIFDLTSFGSPLSDSDESCRQLEARTKL